VQATCPQCQTPVVIEDARAPEKPFGLKCPRCQAVVRFPGRGAAAAPPRVAGGEGPTAAMDELFRTLVEMKASDLHVSVGSPPTDRHDGEIQALPDRAVLTAADTERMLWPIAPERNREEFKRRHDTDFAYEIQDVARFRCNFFMDRKGMGGVFRVIPTKILTA
jgi:twitching motility protein PilT